jgi:hypothetical protein
VHRDHASLEPRLRAAFEPGFVSVLLDRRVAERRREGPDATPDRRVTDRRRPEARYRVTSRREAYTVLEARGRVTADCPACQQPCEYEMPQFGDPPARLTVEIHHLVKRVTGTLRSTTTLAEAQVQHAAEIMAYSSTGRPVLSCVVHARTV